ncbi:hypothetical protein LINGRAHAP2_LOCUS18877, partial [Linum grandiflorum]
RINKLNNLRSSFCGERGSNTRPSDLQSDALPTELSPLDDVIIALLVYLSTTSLTITNIL